MVLLRLQQLLEPYARGRCQEGTSLYDNGAYECLLRVHGVSGSVCQGQVSGGHVTIMFRFWFLQRLHQ